MVYQCAYVAHNHKVGVQLPLPQQKFALSRCSSVVEQAFHKRWVAGSIPAIGITEWRSERHFLLQ